MAVLVEGAAGLRGEVATTEDGTPVLWAYLPGGVSATE